jgi:phosphoserine aminotransferase
MADVTDSPSIAIPPTLLPADGRFCSGPSKVRQEALDALAATGGDYMGTSHRKVGVQFVVADLRNKLAEMLNLPDGYEILLGNGGTTAFWDAAVFGLINDRSQHLSFGEFSGKFAKAVLAAPFLGDPTVITAEPGTRTQAVAEDGIDAYALTHNETSTGVSMDLVRPEGADGLVLVDATSAAGGLRFDASQTDVYYFAPQKCLASDGGLWIAACSPAAIDRIESIAASDRWVPPFFDLKIALDNSRKDQTYNTPALATIFLTLQQVTWVVENGGLEFAAGRSDASAEILYSWADNHELATPYVTDPAARSHVVGTIDFDDSVDANQIASILRDHGVLDTESYRKLGRNQLRIAMFPAIDSEDVAALTRCIDHIIGELG